MSKSSKRRRRAYFTPGKFLVVASTAPHNPSLSDDTIYTSAAPTELVRPACSTRPLALSLSPFATPVIIIVKSSVAKAQPFGRSERQEATAATSPAAPTIDAGNCPGGPENRSSNGKSIVTSPGMTETMLMAYCRTNGRADKRDTTSGSVTRSSDSCIQVSSKWRVRSDLADHSEDVAGQVTR